MDIDAARVSIAKAMLQNGEYTHNIISCVLRSVAATYSDRVANELIEQFNLTQFYGIHPHIDGHYAVDFEL